MRNFVDNVIVELKTDSELKDNSLVKLVAESASSSLNNGENPDKIYNTLKSSLVEISEKFGSTKLKDIVDKLNKNEETIDSKVLELTKVGRLVEKLESIKESSSYSNPIISQKVDAYLEKINSGILEFTLYPQFVREFEPHLVEKTVDFAVSAIQDTIDENRKNLEVLFSINQMNGGVKFPLYENVCNYLKECLVSGKYNSDSIRMQFRELDLPLINSLVENLKALESKSSEVFTIGNGNGDTRVDNVIAPSTKGNGKGVILYHDDRFISIAESNKPSGNESKIHVNADGFIISTLKPEYVKENHSNFYVLCESYAKLGFRKSDSHSGVESTRVRNFKMGFAINENNELDLLINDEVIENAKTVNISEALVMESNEVTALTNVIFDNLDSFSNFEFIKKASNHTTLKESTVIKLNENYYLCDHVNAAERDWKKVNALELYEYFLGNYKYDIKNTFGTELTKEYRKRIRQEKKKFKVQENISKLEETILKLDDALSHKGLDNSKITKLEKIKESVNDQISSLKERYISLSVSEGSGCTYGSNPSDSDFKIYSFEGDLMHTSVDGKCGAITREDCEKACADGVMKKHSQGYQYCEGYPKK